jgi:hypothetical protein
MSIRFVELLKSTQADKKYTAVFVVDDGKTQRIHKVHFGGFGFADYTSIPTSNSVYAESLRDRFLKRNQADSIIWNDSPLSPKALSRWILWGNHQDIEKNIEEYKARFGL